MTDPITITAEVAGRIDPAFVREYLLGRGWLKLEDQGEHAELFTCPFAYQEFSHDALIVYRREFADYTRCMVRAIRDIARAENLPLFDVVRDLDPWEQRRTAVVEAGKRYLELSIEHARLYKRRASSLWGEEYVNAAEARNEAHVELMRCASELLAFEQENVEVAK